MTSWFTSKGLGKTLDEVTVTIPHDIYVFGTQENSVGDREWLDLLRGSLKELTDLDYRPVRVILLSSPPPHTLPPTILLDLTHDPGELSLWSLGISFRKFNWSPLCYGKGSFSLVPQEKGVAALPIL